MIADFPSAQAYIGPDDRRLTHHLAVSLFFQGRQWHFRNAKTDDRYSDISILTISIIADIPPPQKNNDISIFFPQM